MLAEPPCKHQGHDHTDGNQEQLSPMSFTYTSCYCEENVYFLISALIDRGAAASADELYAVFVSNPAKQIPLWQQRAGQRTGAPGSLVVWDYHVLLLQVVTQRGQQQEQEQERVARVWDQDTLLPFPCSAGRYAVEALRADLELKPTFQRRYRVVPAATLLRHFASDRRHMRLPPLNGAGNASGDGAAGGGGAGGTGAAAGVEGGNGFRWSAPPPPYPPIVAPADGCVHNLDRYWDMGLGGEGEGEGQGQGQQAEEDGEEEQEMLEEDADRGGQELGEDTLCALRARVVTHAELVAAGPYGMALREREFLTFCGVR